MKVHGTRNGRAASMRQIGLVALLALAAVWVAAPATARSPVRGYSEVLAGNFAIDSFNFPGYGRYTAAAVIELDDHSPLHQAGVRAGDIITRLDNIRVTNLARLDGHYCWTTVRFFRPRNANPWDEGGKTCYQREIHIPNGRCRCQ